MKKKIAGTNLLTGEVCNGFADVIMNEKTSIATIIISKSLSKKLGTKSTTISFDKQKRLPIKSSPIL